jgi:peptidoglycan-associated lipoprotein
LLLVLACVVSAGCAKKRATSTPPSSPEQVQTSDPSPSLPPPAPQESSLPDADPLAGDLESVNRYVVDQGLLVPVYFDYDRSELREDARSSLQRNAAFMKAHPQFVVTIEGHCDERGTIEYNLDLGQLRASSVRAYLSGLGVQRQQLQTVSYGREKPFCAGSGEACWSSNRRAHFAITDRH